MAYPFGRFKIEVAKRTKNKVAVLCKFPNSIVESFVFSFANEVLPTSTPA